MCIDYTESHSAYKVMMAAWISHIRISMTSKLVCSSLPASSVSFRLSVSIVQFLPDLRLLTWGNLQSSLCIWKLMKLPQVKLFLKVIKITIDKFITWFVSEEISAYCGFNGSTRVDSNGTVAFQELFFVLAIHKKNIWLRKVPTELTHKRNKWSETYILITIPIAWHCFVKQDIESRSCLTSHNSHRLSYFQW